MTFAFSIQGIRESDVTATPKTKPHLNEKGEKCHDFSNQAHATRSGTVLLAGLVSGVWSCAVSVDAF